MIYVRAGNQCQVLMYDVADRGGWAQRVTVVIDSKLSGKGVSEGFGSAIKILFYTSLRLDPMLKQRADTRQCAYCNLKVVQR